MERSAASTSGGVYFRSYQPGDLDALYALDTICFTEPFRFSRRLMAQLVDAPYAHTIVADEESVVAGFVIVHMEHWERELIAYIMTLDVTPEQRRHGLATELMQRAEEAAREVHADALALHVWVENEGAVRFYEGAGYQRVELVERFYNEAGNAWLYRKPL